MDLDTVDNTICQYGVTQKPCQEKGLAWIYWDKQIDGVHTASLVCIDHLEKALQLVPEHIVAVQTKDDPRAPQSAPSGPGITFTRGQADPVVGFVAGHLHTHQNQ